MNIKTAITIAEKGIEEACSGYPCECQNIRKGAKSSWRINVLCLLSLFPLNTAEWHVTLLLTVLYLVKVLSSNAGNWDFCLFKVTAVDGICLPTMSTLINAAFWGTM